VFSEIVGKNRRRVPAAEARVEGHSTVEDRQPRNHKVQKFSSGVGSPGWSRKKGRKTVVCVLWSLTSFAACAAADWFTADQVLCGLRGAGRWSERLHALLPRRGNGHMSSARGGSRRQRTCGVSVDRVHYRRQRSQESGDNSSPLSSTVFNVISRSLSLSFHLHSSIVAQC